MSETPRARYYLSSFDQGPYKGADAICGNGRILAMSRYREDAERIVQALNHECAATHDHAERLIDESEAEIESHKCAATPEQVKALAEGCRLLVEESKWWDEVPPSVVAVQKLLKDLGYE
jgi:hypothetical protein